MVKKLFIWLSAHWLFGLIVVFAIYSRLIGNNWDSGHHLHPDERFLTMVQLALKFPTSFAEYLQSQTSSFNPHNQGYSFFVYGTLPLLINKTAALFLNLENYGYANLLGRALSGVADLAIVLVVYQLAWQFFTHQPLSTRKAIATAAAASYALAVLPIQLAHFFTSDQFLSLFLLLSLLHATRYYHAPRPKHLLFAAVSFGLALACKINAILLAPLLLICVSFPSQHHNIPKLQIKNLLLFWQLFWQFLLRVGVFALVAYLIVRIGSPHYFSSDFWSLPKLAPQFIQNLVVLKQYEDPNTWFPPAIQWLSKPKIWHSLQNIWQFGYGPVLSVLCLVGIGSLVSQHLPTWRQRQSLILLLSLGWMASFLLYQSLQFVQAIRYYTIVYPLFAVWSGYGWWWLLQRLHHSWWRCLVGFGLAVSALIWPLAFLSIYHQPHSRVAASVWMYQHIPNHSLLGFEYWDDPLPIGPAVPFKQYVGESLHVFDQDTLEKWHTLNQQFDQIDYYVLSSNRAWASIQVLPGKYPLMSAFYKDLLQGQTDFELVAEFTSYPSLRYLGIPIDFQTDTADESFTVYDHPKVMVFVNRDSPRQPEIVGYN